MLSNSQSRDLSLHLLWNVKFFDIIMNYLVIKTLTVLLQIAIYCRTDCNIVSNHWITFYSSPPLQCMPRVCCNTNKKIQSISSQIIYGQRSDNQTCAVHFHLAEVHIVCCHSLNDDISVWRLYGRAWNVIPLTIFCYLWSISTLNIRSWTRCCIIGLYVGKSNYEVTCTIS